MKTKSLIAIGLIVGAMLIAATFIIPEVEPDQSAGAPNSPITFQGYVRDIENADGNISMLIDDVDFLNGEEAITAAITDTGCARERIEECVGSLAGGFYIRNAAPTTERYEVTSNAEIILLLGGSSEQRTVTLQKLQNEFESEGSILDSVPFVFHIEQGEVIRIEQMYVP